MQKYKEITHQMIRKKFILEEKHGKMNVNSAYTIINSILLQDFQQKR